jgi:hypothetical protein
MVENYFLIDYISLAIKDFEEASRISMIANKDLLLVGDRKGHGKEWAKARMCLANARLRDGLRGN